MIELHPSGALWLPARRTALIADLHLGFAWAQRRRGELWPLTDAGAKVRLEALCDELKPKTLVLVGDTEQRRAAALAAVYQIEVLLKSISREVDAGNDVDEYERETVIRALVGRANVLNDVVGKAIDKDDRTPTAQLKGVVEECG